MPLSLTVEAQVEPEAQVVGWVAPEVPPELVNVQFGVLLELGVMTAPEA